MPILTTANTTAIDTTEIAKGYFIRAKYHTWKTAYNGIVAAVSAKEILVLYLGDIGNVTNYFTISVGEIKAGLWELAWSSNFTEIKTEDDGL